MNDTNTEHSASGSSEHGNEHGTDHGSGASEHDTEHASDTEHGSPTSNGSANGKVSARTVNAVKIFGSGSTEVRALDNVNIEFNSGVFTSIMGPSGSGKSTLMHCLAGLENLTEGDSYIGDTNLRTLSERQLTLLRRDHVGFVFQAFNLVPTLTAKENMTLPMNLAGRSPDNDWFDEVISTVGLGDRLTHRPTELSGGQQQRVAVARALASRPSIIFADEPTGNLDSRSGNEILSFLQRAVDDFGQTVVMVTHSPEAASYSDRAVFLSDGQIVQELHQPTFDNILDTVRNMGD